jgi:hypothetical protein
VKVAIGDQKAEVGEADGDRRDRGIRLAQPRQNHHRDSCHDETEQQAAHELAQKHHHGAARIGNDFGRQGVG